jgi:hypothetical protein
VACKTLMACITLFMDIMLSIYAWMIIYLVCQ